MANEDTAAKTPTEEALSVEHTRSGRHYRPDVDIYEKEDELVLLADMPGTKGDKIDLQFEDGTLTIRAPVEPSQDADARYLLREYGVGDYHRTFRVSEAIDPGKITAQFADGVLKLRLPKSEAAKPRKIAVEAK